MQEYVFNRILTAGGTPFFIYPENEEYVLTYIKRLLEK